VGVGAGVGVGVGVGVSVGVGVGVSVGVFVGEGKTGEFVGAWTSAVGVQEKMTIVPSSAQNNKAVMPKGCFINALLIT
jgi:hypothetical protein